MNLVKEQRESSQLLDELEQIVREEDEQIDTLHKQIGHLVGLVFAMSRIAKPEATK